MATVPVTQPVDKDVTLRRVVWEGFTGVADVGSSVDLGAWPDRSVQVLGDFGTGGEVTVEGSNDGGTVWATLSDAQGNALVFSAAGIKTILDLPEKIRVNGSAGTLADIDVYMFFRGTK